MILSEVYQEKSLMYFKQFLNEYKLIYSQCNKVLFRIIKTNVLSKISLKDGQINENMSEKLFANMIFSLYFIEKQLFIQIMCKNQLIQVNRSQEIMKNVDLPLVLIHPPEEVRRLDLCR